MSEVRLGDGAPVWEGAAVKSQKEAGLIVTSISPRAPATVQAGFDYQAKHVTLDLTHRPTWLELAARVCLADASFELVVTGDNAGEFDAYVGSASHEECVGSEDPAALLALWLKVDPARSK